MPRKLRWRRGRKVGKYRLKRRIGKGGFADVFRATDTVQRLEVALKLPRRHDEDELADLEYEVRVASELSHPNLLPVLNADYVDAGRRGEVLVVAYPLGDCSLSTRVKRPVSTLEAIEIIQQILLGLQYAHEHSIVHCDVKPCNVICFPENIVKLGDFGLCKRADGSFQTSEPGGTLGYMAPELAMGYPSPRSDVFAVGIIAYEMLADTSPEWPFDWPPPRIGSIHDGAPELVEVLRKSLEPDSRKRYASALAMLEDLSAAKREILRRYGATAPP